MGNKSFLTIEDLVSFFDSHKIYNFSSKETGKKIIVKSVQDFSSKFEVAEENNKLFAKVKVCHTLLNRNGSYIPEESMKAAMPSLKYDPLLASIHQLDDGSWDFHSHDFHVEENSDGEEEIVYDEHQVGTFTNDEPFLEYDADMDKTYVIAKVAIPIEYTRTAEIIQSKGETKVSCEISVNSCSYDAKNKYLIIDDFEFLGCTLLGSEKDGTPIGEGMLGSKLTLEDFSIDNNSMFSKISELQARLDELKSACSDIHFSREGGNLENMKKTKAENQVEEVLEFDGSEEENEDPGNENGNQEDPNAQTENTTTETPTEGNGTQEQGGGTTGTQEQGSGAEQGSGTEQGGGTTDTQEQGSGTGSEQGSGTGGQQGSGSGSDEGQGTQDEPTVIDDDEQEKARKFNINDGKIEFSMSINDKLYAVSDLVNATYSDVDNTYYFVIAYDNYVIMADIWNDKYYKQSYSESDGIFTLTGDRVPVYVEYVTDDEMKSLDEMRTNYSSIKEELERYKYAESYADKMTVFDDASYSDYLDTDEFKNIMKKEFVDQYSKEELAEKADAALGKLVKISKKFSFTAKNTEKKVSSIKVNATTKDAEEKKPYGNLFD
jgi:hypothetical protein